MAVTEQEEVKKKRGRSSRGAPPFSCLLHRVIGRSGEGIGGSGDFTRNAYVSIFSCPSSQKGGKISTIVPLVTHMDHSEHSVQIVVTEHGVAHLYGKNLRQRARAMIDIAHPDHREWLSREAHRRFSGI